MHFTQRAHSTCPFKPSSHWRQDASARLVFKNRWNIPRTYVYITPAAHDQTLQQSGGCFPFFLSFFYFLSLCLYRIGLNRDVLLDVAFAVLNAPCTSDSFLYRHVLKSFFQSRRRAIWLRREGKKERERCLSPQEMNQFVSVNPHVPTPQKKQNYLAMAAAAPL